MPLKYFQMNVIEQINHSEFFFLSVRTKIELSIEMFHTNKMEKVNKLRIDRID